MYNSHMQYRQETLRFFRIGAPGEIRTPDPLVRSQVLYPAELRAHIFDFRDWRRERDSNPRWSITPILP